MLQTPQAALDFILSLQCTESLVDIAGASSCRSSGFYSLRGGATVDMKQVQQAKQTAKKVGENITINLPNKETNNNKYTEYIQQGIYTTLAILVLRLITILITIIIISNQQ